MTNYGIIILAAGNSSRLGEPKQLLAFEGKTLIRRITEAALAVAASHVWVVTGANAAPIEAELAGLPCRFAFNADWQEGMSASIKTGISAMQSQHPDINGAILAVSDQPFVTAALLEELFQTAVQKQAGIVACAYAGAPGTPAFFSAEYFPALLQLTGAEGAKKLFKRYQNDLSTIPFPQGEIDIDTKQDYNRLITGR
ncbi:hypothetical protein GCM10010967_12450 [Dyadobacter beijingensis]|uniref:MobA-like NTP transferase domain-containing protein n=1 Tax=Dyadobacter beijingensis TaxID=365489 RepID=A0ABQ2HJU7_9BACT|nr:nucleotidyltransferase family protein [Dyadobacter beijingensis]GGM82299.1 hypothetical protein GCM10010967_12450 [Dyadobacter beijingensis]